MKPKPSRPENRDLLVDLIAGELPESTKQILTWYHSLILGLCKEFSRDLLPTLKPPGIAGLLSNCSLDHFVY